MRHQLIFKWAKISLIPPSLFAYFKISPHSLIKTRMEQRSIFRIWFTTVVVVILALVPISILLSYAHRKPLGMQTLIDLATRDLLILQIIYILSFLAILTVPLIFTSIPSILALAAVGFLYTSVNALLVHVGLHRILISLLCNCNHIFDNVNDGSVMTLTRLVNLFITAFLSFFGLFYTGNIYHSKIYQLLIGDWTSTGGVFKSYAVIGMGIIDTGLYIVLQYKLESKTTKQDQIGNNNPSYWTRVKELLFLGKPRHNQQDPGNNNVSQVEEEDKYTMGTLRAMSMLVGLGLAAIVIVVAIEAFQASTSRTRPLLTHIVAIFVMILVSNTFWIANSPKMLDYTSLQLKKIKERTMRR